MCYVAPSAQSADFQLNLMLCEVHHFLGFLFISYVLHQIDSLCFKSPNDESSSHSSLKNFGAILDLCKWNSDITQFSFFYQDWLTEKITNLELMYSIFCQYCISLKQNRCSRKHRFDKRFWKKCTFIDFRNRDNKFFILYQKTFNEINFQNAEKLAKTTKVNLDWMIL